MPGFSLLPPWPPRHQAWPGADGFAPQTLVTRWHVMGLNPHTREVATQPRVSHLQGCVHCGTILSPCLLCRGFLTPQGPLLISGIYCAAVSLSPLGPLSSGDDRLSAEPTRVFGVVRDVGKGKRGGVGLHGQQGAPGGEPG